VSDGNGAAHAGSAGALEAPGTPGEAMLDVRDLRTHYPVPGGILRRPVAWVKAVDGVSFSVMRGETFGLVGESGCGKTTVGRSIIGLLRPTSGAIVFGGNDLQQLPRAELKVVRRDMQIIFQDPNSSLNPRMTVEEIVGEGLAIHGLGGRKERHRTVHELLEVVGLRSNAARRFPHEFSGGQRQRIGIARALALRPKLVICDEPVSALDLSIQSQVLNLLKDLQEQYGLTYLFIAHDLSVVEYMSDRVGVMYLGKLVEVASVQALYAAPRMPYTIALLSASPNPDPTVQRSRIVLQGDVPSPIKPPSGCPFRTRCWMAQDVCAEATPPLRQVDDGHWAACHFADDVKAHA
jgi:oligopeptide/dipeptide ABC transporter ATP-binding protein